MSKHIYKIVLTGGPAAGKTSLVSRVIEEFEHEENWRVITIPETATELISGFGLKPFGGCMSMLAFQDFVIADQIHKEALALQACDVVTEENIVLLYDRALMDDKAYISDEEFREVIARFDGRTEEAVLQNYDMVLHLVTCAKGAEYAYNLGNAARSETVEGAREMDDRTLRAWSGHPNRVIVDNSTDFEDKLKRAMRAINAAVGREVPAEKKRKYLVALPDLAELSARYAPARLELLQTYLQSVNSGSERRLRCIEHCGNTLYFYAEKRRNEDGTGWVCEKLLTPRLYREMLQEADTTLQPVRKTKYRFVSGVCRYELDVYPFSTERAILFCYGTAQLADLPEGIQVLREVSDSSEFKNLQLAIKQQL